MTVPKLKKSSEYCVLCSRSQEVSNIDLIMETM